MTSYLKFNKARNKLNDREFFCKEFFDVNGEKEEFNGGRPHAVYLKSEVDEALELIKVQFGIISDENFILIRKNEELELENFKLKKKLAKVKH